MNETNEYQKTGTETEMNILNKPSSSESKPIEFWIKVWGVMVILESALTIPIGLLFPQWFQIQWENVIIGVAYGAALIWGKRIYAMRLLGLIFSFLWIGGGFTLTYYHTAVQSNFFPRMYYFTLALFYIGLFIFLLTPNVKEAYGPSPIPKTPLIVLASEEERKIKFWVRIVALLLVLEGLVGYLFSDWYESHGLPNEGRIAVVFYTIASLGLLLFRQNIGRRFTLFV